MKEQYRQRYLPQIFNRPDIIRNLIAGILVVLVSVGSSTLVQAQIETSYKTITSDSGMQLPDSANSQHSWAFHTVAVDLHARNVESFAEGVSEDEVCQVRLMSDSDKSCTIGMKKPPSSDGAEFVFIQYDQGRVFEMDVDATILFRSLNHDRWSTRFIPKTSSEDDREVRIDRIWLAPYYDNQFRRPNWSPSSPRDLTVYIYSDDGGRPGNVLFSKVIDDPRDFTRFSDLELDFFELDLSNEGIGALPDVIHISYGDAGDDDNVLYLGLAPYTKEDVSHIYVDDAWIPLWTSSFVGDEYLFNETVLPIRARFELIGDFRVQAEQETTLPEIFVVHGNYPNPFQRSTNLQFDLPASARVTVEVIDILGRRVLTVPPVDLSAGWGKRIEVDGQSLPSGHYLYRIVMHSETGNSTQTGQFVHFR